MRQFIREAIGALIIGAIVLYMMWMAGYLKAPAVESAPRRTATPTPCETIAEGVERCPLGFATSVARPGDFAPRRGTPTPKPKR